MGRRLNEPAENPSVPVCSRCGRARYSDLDAHPMDAYDYSPFQMIIGTPLGWYSGSDGEMCPEDMTELTARGNS